MKTVYSVLISMSLFGCLAQKTTPCQNMTAFNGNFKANGKTIYFPHWNDKEITFSNSETGQRHTFKQSNTAWNTTNGSWDSQQPGAYVHNEVSYDMDNAKVLDLSGKYNCTKDRYSLTIRLFENPGYDGYANNILFGDNPVTIDNYAFKGQKRSVVKFDNSNLETSNDYDTMYFIWDYELGLLEYQSKTKGIFKRI